MTVITTIINLFLGFFVYLRNPKGYANQLFALLVTSLVAWVVTLFFYYRISDPRALLFIGRMNFAVAAPLTYFFYRFISVFPKVTVRPPKFIFYLSSLLTLGITMLSMFTPFIDKKETALGAERVMVYGELWPLWVIVFLANLVIALVILILKIRRSKGIIRTQLLYLLYGFCLLFTFGIFTNLILPSINNFSIQQLGPLSTVFFVGFTTYAIIRHRLLDIRLIVARSVTYTILMSGIVLTYILAIYSLSSYISNYQFEFSVFLTIGIALTFQYVREWINNITDNLFFRTNYNSHILLAELTAILAKTIRLDEMAHSSLEEMLSVMHISKGAIYFHEDKRSYPSVLVGYNKEYVFGKEYLNTLHGRSSIIVYDEVEDDAEKKMMRKYDASIIMPLISGENRQGILVLGEKNSGEVYSERDIEVIQIFGPELSVALANAKSYEEIKKFNETLQAKVEDATRELKNANEHLKELDKLKDEFIAIASHELRTPMTVIRGNLWIVLEESKNLDNESKERLETSLGSAEHLITLVTQILDVSAIEGNKIKLSPKKIDLEDTVREVENEVGQLASQKNIVITNTIDGKKYEVFVDPDKLKQVFVNLISNAIKFTKEGGTITIGAVKDSKFVTVLVSDTGQGISKENLPKLFTKFGKIETSLNKVSNAPGAGLGLYICKKLIELWGGKINADSKVGNGMTFSFTIPMP